MHAVISDEFQPGPCNITGTSSILHSIAALTSFDDGSGPALYAAGYVYLPNTGSPVARYRYGRWTSMAVPKGGFGRAFAAAQLPANGEPRPALYLLSTQSLHRLDGDQWRFVAQIPTQVEQSSGLVAWQDSQGPMLVAARSRVMAWRGTGAWSDYGTGLPINADITSINSADDGSGRTLFVTGSANGAGFVRKLVGNQWIDVAIPFMPASQYVFEDVKSFDDDNGPVLFVTGRRLAGTGPGYALFRGSSWSSGPTLGSGLSSRLFIVDEGGRQTLWASINDTLKEWDGHAFISTVVAGTSPWTSYVSAMTGYNDGTGASVVFAGPQMRMPRPANAPAGDATAVWNIAQFVDGRVESFAKGLGYDPHFGEELTVGPFITTVDLPSGEFLFAAGSFFSAGGSRSRGAMLFDGDAWTPLDLPMVSSIPFYRVPPAVGSVDGRRQLVVHVESRIMAWDGDVWTSLSTSGLPSGTLRAMVNLPGGLHYLSTAGLHRYAQGAWSPESPLTDVTAATTADLGVGERAYLSGTHQGVTGVFAWDGANPLPVGQPIPPVTSMEFHVEHGVPTLFAYSRTARAIFRLEEGAWVSSPLLGGSAEDSIRLVSFKDGGGPALYAVGDLFHLDETPHTSLIARWRAGRWSGLYRVVPAGNIGFQQSLKRPSVAVFQNRLYIADDFYSFYGVPANRLVALDPCPVQCLADYDADGNLGTDEDVAAFFRCLTGDCCPRCTQDFNNDGDFGTDQDVESFFRVLTGGAC